MLRKLIVIWRLLACFEAVEVCSLGPEFLRRHHWQELVAKAYTPIRATGRWHCRKDMELGICMSKLANVATCHQTPDAGYPS